jgi:hypothetical protein
MLKMYIEGEVEDGGEVEVESRRGVEVEEGRRRSELATLFL